uniref:Xrn1 N-terminal domain-containing protein n=1 Tax=viral metagenome TaxID=1070528 RepID=A0A6C0B1C0_9ZZZZ
MGIPSYFSYIVKNHSSIIRKLLKGDMSINNLYLDCNSIIYDAVRNIDFDSLTEPATRSIICKVNQKIEEYISLITPNDTIMIAFDGVAPVAKLEQQRNRRYKSWFQNEISKSIFKKPIGNDPWNTTAITPGTEFMRDLNESVAAHFKDASKYNVQNIIVSTSDEVGEGEHKIFDYIRSNSESHVDKTTVIYGLDADLIMLSINHLPINDRIFLFRETPEFIKSIDASLEPNETYLLDIPELANIITLDMNNQVELTTQQQKNRIYDYIFMCFFLGNDFMPHFPALNIRTGGVDKMLNAYKATIGGTNENLTDGKQIFWKPVRTMIEWLAQNEDDFIKTEMKLRDRREKTNYLSETPEQKYMKFEAIPNYEREIEKYIKFGKEGWRYRYYKCLFKIDINEERCKEICINYLQGLEWTMKYYTSGCPDFRWCYQHNYPPLLQDLIRFTPYFDTSFIQSNTNKAVIPLVQLCYVLPRHSLDFLPEKLSKALKRDHADLYPTDCEFAWAFCKYFWECHVELPHINVDALEEYVHAVVKS